MARVNTRRGSPLHITPSFHLFYKSKDLVLEHIWVFGPLFGFQMLFLINSWITNPNTLHGRSLWGYRFENSGAGWTSPSLPNYAWGLILGIGIFSLIFLAISVIVQIMLHTAQLEAAKGKTPNFPALWQTVKDIGWRMLGLYLLVALYILVGLILFIVPGLIMLRRYFLAPYVLLDDRKSIKDAMDKSAVLSKSHSGTVWGVIGVMFLISLVNIVPFIGGLVSFILGVLYSVAPALRYQELKHLPKND